MTICTELSKKKKWKKREAMKKQKTMKLPINEKKQATLTP